MGQEETAVTGKNRIMIYGPKNDGTYIIEFKMAAGEALAISVPAGETRVLKYFQERMPMGSSCRTFREGTSGAPFVLPKRSPHAKLSATAPVKVPKTPPLVPSGGVLVWAHGLSLCRERDKRYVPPMPPHLVALVEQLKTQK